MATTDPILKRVVIIGASWAGLVAAKTYLQIDPNIKLTIFDSERTLGGVWSKDRLFPGFMADGPTGLFDYSDLPMRDVIDLKDWSDLPGEKVYDYLHACAARFHLIERLRLSTTISHISRNIDGKAWDVRIADSEEIVTCDKLILATGLYSKPYWPDVPREDFHGFVMHSKEMGIHHRELTSEKVNRITVYGGCKSSVDAIIFCLQAGKKVDWVIRETGNSPGLMAEVRKHGVHGAILVDRWKNILTPSIFSTTGFWYNFLHSGKSRMGYWICRSLWAKASTAIFTMEPYKTKSPNMEKLMPETPDALFFTAGAIGLHGNKTFNKALHRGEDLQVHRASITSMSGNTVSLSKGETVPADAAIFGTGWDFRSTLFDPADALELGTNALLKDEHAATSAYWQKLQADAEKEVLETLPILKAPPPHHKPDVEYTPLRLYRYILPSSLVEKNDRSLVYLGLVTNTQTSIYAEVSALWGVSWMEGLLDISKSKEELDYEIAKVNVWMARRYLSRGRTRQIASAEIQDVTDILMRDMGLKVYRKSNWISEIFAPLRAQDYKGIVQEMVDKSGK